MNQPSLNQLFLHTRTFRSLESSHNSWQPISRYVFSSTFTRSALSSRALQISNTARELTKLAGVIQVPFRAGNQLLTWWRCVPTGDNIGSYRSHTCIRGSLRNPLAFYLRCLVSLPSVQQGGFQVMSVAKGKENMVAHRNPRTYSQRQDSDHRWPTCWSGTNRW